MLNVTEFQRGQESQWDHFLGSCANATLLHSRAFLEHQGDRFRDSSIMLWEDDHLIGVLPIAAKAEEPQFAISHPGLTYGGVVHDGSLRGERMVEAVELARMKLSSLGFSKLRYKAIPQIYQDPVSEDDEFALFNLGAQVSSLSLNSVIDLRNVVKFSKRKRRNLKKSKEVGVARADSLQARDFFCILDANLQSRHGVKPVHSLEEFLHLNARFPDQLQLSVAILENEVVAGVWWVITKRASHAQYIAMSDMGAEVCAIDAIINHQVELQLSNEVPLISLGVSTDPRSNLLNSGLYAFKTEFGAQSQSMRHWELQL